MCYILGVDESQHEDLILLCEGTRMAKFFTDLQGNTFPSRFIRWNPDVFKQDNETYSITQKHRHATLINIIYITTFTNDFKVNIYFTQVTN